MRPEVRVKRHPDGTRYVQPYLGTNPVTGRRIRPYRSFPASMTDEEVEREAKRWLAEVSAALRLGTSLRLGDMLSTYVDWIEAEGTAANTCRSYRSIVRNYLCGLAAIDPRRVTSSMLGDLYHQLLVSGGHSGRPLSPNTVRQVHWFLRGGYDWLVERGVCETNPVLSASKPRLMPHEAVALDEDELYRLFGILDEELRTVPDDHAGIVRRTHLFAAWMALHTGMRCGECCAVRRMDVRLAQGMVRVTGTVVDAGGGVVRQPMTKGHRPRNVAVTDEDARVIGDHLEWQDSRMGSGLAKRTLVSVDGSLCRPKEVSATFRQLARECGLPEGVTFHSLRHTHGTWLLVAGTDIKTVSERLGHADVATTLRVYAHVLSGRDSVAAQNFAALKHRREEEV